MATAMSNDEELKNISPSEEKASSELIKPQSETFLSKKDKKKQSSAEKKEFLKAKREEFQANKQVGYSSEGLNDTEYYFEGGLRKVKVDQHYFFFL